MFRVEVKKWVFKELLDRRLDADLGLFYIFATVIGYKCD